MATPNIPSGLVDKFKREVAEIEFRTDLTDDEKVTRITHITCAACAGIAIQPIPFADILILTPIQAYFGTRIAAIRGVPAIESDVGDLIKKIASIVGLGVVAQQLAIGIWKFITAGMGGIMTIPIVYGLTYAIMSVIDAYYSSKSKGKILSDAEIRNIYERAKRDGEKKGKKHEADINADK